jgi:predicted metalloprotease
MIMQWKGRRESENVEDQRTLTPGRVAAGGGVGILVLALITYFLGGDPQKVLELVKDLPQPEAQQRERKPNPEQDERAQFVKVVLADTEDVWTEQFRKMGKTYREPRLVLFSGRVESACGLADAAVGPFYCGGDQKVYVDLDFFEELKTRFKAPGDFAQAYVIAHEIGHHVQNQLGITDKVHSQQGRISKKEYNRLSVRLELQADFLAEIGRAHV